MKIEFTVIEDETGKRYFSTTFYRTFKHLSPSLAWSGSTLTCSRADGSKRDIHITEFTNLLDGRFQENDKMFGRLETFHFNVGDRLAIELNDDTTFSFPSYCIEIGEINNSFEANRKLDLIVTEYDGRHFFEVVVGPQVFVFDEFSAVPFYYTSRVSGKIIRDEQKIGDFYPRNNGGMDCYYYHFTSLKSEFSQQSQMRPKGPFDLISASRLQVGDKIELESYGAFVPLLVREWANESRTHAYSLKRADIEPHIPNNFGRIVIDFATLPSPQ